VNWYSQFGEDEWIFNNVPNLPKEGFFCEVGAYDGRASSNTLAFEEMGWHGCCVEPDPQIANQCRHNRRAFTLTCAIGDKSKAFPFQAFHINRADRGTSGLDREPTGESIMVPVKSLEDVMDLWNPPSLDLLSIDTEGTELQVWLSRGIRWDPKVVVIEFLTEPGMSRLDRIREQLEQDKYKLVHTTHANAIFVPL
jgi:FkbM family methyltransferase